MKKPRSKRQSAPSARATDPLADTFYDVPITCTGTEETYISVCLPVGGMGSNRVISIPKASIPAKLISKIVSGLTFQVEASIGVRDPKDMKFRNFRVPDETAAQQFDRNKTVFPWMKHSDRKVKG